MILGILSFRAHQASNHDVGYRQKIRSHPNGRRQAIRAVWQYPVGLCSVQTVAAAQRKTCVRNGSTWMDKKCSGRFCESASPRRLQACSKQRTPHPCQIPFRSKSSVLRRINGRAEKSYREQPVWAATARLKRTPAKKRNDKL